MSEFVVAVFLNALIETAIAPLFKPVQKKIDVVLREVFSRLKNNKNLPKDVLKAPLSTLSEQDVLTIKKIVAETLSEYSIPTNLTYKEFEKQLVVLRKEQENLSTELRVNAARILQGLSVLGTSQIIATQRDLLARKQFALAVKHYQDNYLDILEKAVNKGIVKRDTTQLANFFFSTADDVLFPDKHGKYPQSEAIRDMKIKTKRGKYPLLVRPSGVEIRDEKIHCLPTEIEQPLPFLPLKNGYIHEIDFETKFPSRVEDYPSRAFNGAYYWVKPSGQRWVIVHAWVWSPKEWGMAIWWRPTHKSPLITPIFAKKTEEQKVAEKIEVSKEHYTGLLSEYRRLREILDGTIY